MVAWQKRARLITLVVGVGVVVAVFATTGRRTAPPSTVPVARVDPSATAESKGAVIRQVKGAKENFRLEGDLLSYPDGSSRLTKVKATIDRQGKTYVMTGDESKVGNNQSHIEITGHVHLTSADGLDVVAHSATYSEGEGIVRAPGDVTFSRGRMKGTGVNFTYDTNRDQIGLSDKTNITLAADPNGEGATTISAGSVLLARKDNFASFERSVHIVRTDQIIDADGAIANLTEDEKHITGLQLMNSARIAMPGAAPGGLSAMSGDVINLAYAPDSEVLQRATLAGASSLRFAAEKGSREKTLSANALDITLAPDGATVTALTARDQTVLDLPAPRGQASKSIRSASLVGTGDAQGGLKAAVFTDNVEYRETGGAPPVQRVVTSRVLDTTLANGFGDIREARFSGNVRFRDGGTQATAANVRYQVPTGEVELTGKIGNALPRVDDDRIKVDAALINMTLPGPKLRAQDGVTTLLKPAKPGAGGSKAKMPGIMQQDQQANGNSDKLDYNGDTSLMVFTGNATLWQGETKIQGPAITVEGATGNLSASGGVRSWMTVQDTNAETSEQQKSVARGAGQEMLYEDAQRTVTYRTDANVISLQGDVKGKTVVLFLGSNGQDIDRMKAVGNVTFKEKDRITIGEELNYDASVQEYNMAGTREKLVRMVKREEEGCKESTGRALTFKKGADSLAMTGSEGTRTQTKTVSCAELPPN
ncbi:MAG: LPS export ABC transporter periplasmic protein LptC [Vicinamibacterales bacterium]|nr:LPS export ABC transporter periplasmic protein LptC [Vicinamibacterales bacterium]